MTSAAKRGRGRPVLDESERMELVRTRLLPGCREAVLALVGTDLGESEAAVLRALVERAMEARGEATCRTCGVSIADMPAYYRGVPRERCDVCEEE